MMSFDPSAPFITVLVLPVTGSTSLTGSVANKPANASSSSSSARISAAMRSASALTSFESSGTEASSGVSSGVSFFFSSALAAAYSFSKTILLFLHCCSATYLSNRTSFSTREILASNSASSGSSEEPLGFSFVPLRLLVSWRGRWISNNLVLVSR
jgi:hypothetical protein